MRRQKTENDERAAHDLDRTDEGTHHLGVRNADIGKAPRTEDLGKGELLNSFGKKYDEAHHQARTTIVQPSARVRSTLYPILHGLEEKGYLTSIEERTGSAARRIYRATPAGVRALVAAKIKVRELFGELFEDDLGES